MCFSSLSTHDAVLDTISKHDEARVRSFIRRHHVLIATVKDKMQPTFECLKLLLDEVSELRHVHRARRGMFTIFNFRSGDLVRRSQELRGRLDIHAGMRVAVVLRVPRHWETLVAWRFEHDGREIWELGASPTVTLISFILALLAGVVTATWVVLDALQSNQPAFGFGLGVFCVLLVVGRPFFDWRRSKNIAAALRVHPTQERPAHD